MKINEIKAGMRNVEVKDAVVMGVGPSREVFTKSGPMKVSDHVLGDDTAEIGFSVWNEDIGRFTVGDRISISNAYITTYKGKNSISLGKFGKATVE